VSSVADPILAPKVRDLFFDAGGQWIPSRYKVMWGGRGGLKSWGFARVAVILATLRKVRVLCGREVQKSIADSVHKVLVEQMEMLELRHYFDVQDTWIGARNTGSEFIFAGFRTDPRKVKSTEGVDIAWLEEAEKLSTESWRMLTPTVRKPSSEIWVGFNPDMPGDPTAELFLSPSRERPPRTRIIETNWRDNPWLSAEMREEKDYLARVDPDAYQHVWEGKFRQNGGSQIFAGKYVVESFEPVLAGDGKWDGPYQGADWGFAQDPSTLNRCWIHGRKLYIEREAWQIGCDTHKLADMFDAGVPGWRGVVTRGDNARPETISYLQQHGCGRLIGVEKWSGSVEDGIAFLRQFEQIVIHPRCRHTIEEARLYSYKVDRLSGDVLADVVDKHNHCWDAIRYALQPLIRNANTGFLAFMGEEVKRMNERRAREEQTR
jgi:phage terminase large subunit